MGDDRPGVLRNARQKLDGYTLLRSLDEECARIGWFDPQYREVLDDLQFGNEGKGRQKKRSALPQMTNRDIAMFVEQIERVLKPSGYLFLWIDKYLLGSGGHIDYFRYCGAMMRIVDLLCWDTQRFGMGRRLRSAAQYLVIAQKHPGGAKGTWHDNSLRDFASEKADRDAHVHAKPLEVTKALILATTKPGDLVIDPAAGSYVVLRACRETGREFVGGDLVG